MTIQNPDDVRARNNIPEDVRLVSHFVGGEDDAVNSFGSNQSAHPIKTHIQCVRGVQIKCGGNMELNTAALLDTGSILNFVSHSLIERLGNPQPLGTWEGSLKTVSGLKPISTRFYEIILRDVYNTYQSTKNSQHWPIEYAGHK